MNNLQYLRQLPERTAAAARDFRIACLAVKDPYKAIESGGWNVHQIAVHTRDVDKLVYGLRAQQTLAEENPFFTNFDGDAYMTTKYDPREPLADLLDGFVSSVTSLAKNLESAPERAWARTSTHETGGAGLTVQIWVERGLKHIEEHLETVKKAH